MTRCAAVQLGLLIVLLTASAYGQAPSHNENLKPLVPLIGKWTGDFTVQEDLGELAKAGETVNVMAVYGWTKNRQAVTLSIAVKADNEWVYLTDGWIVFDPQKKKITGMDSYADGGIFRHQAEIHEDKLVFRGRGSTADGLSTESTVVYSNIMEDSFTGQLIDRREEDKKLPDSEPFTFTRVKE